MSEPVIVEIFASLNAVRTTLVSLGATSPDRRSVAYQIGETLLLLGTDETEESTVVAVGGGEDTDQFVRWLVHEFTDVLPCRIRTLPSEHDLESTA